MTLERADSRSVDLPTEFYLIWKERSTGITFRRHKPKKSRSTVRGSIKNRDPKLIQDVLGEIANSFGWDEVLHDTDVLNNWEDIVGKQVANKTTPKNIERNVLQVECDSTAWATQLRRMRVDIIAKIKNMYPKASIEDIRFYVTGVPSWRYGHRVVKGRGPRDTYK